MIFLCTNFQEENKMSTKRTGKISITFYKLTVHTLQSIVFNYLVACTSSCIISVSVCVSVTRIKSVDK